MNIRYIFDLIVVSLISALSFYFLFSDVDFTVDKAPWVIIGILLIPVTLIFNTKKEIASLTELDKKDITQTERGRLISQKDFASKILLLSLFVCLIIAFLTGLFFYYISSAAVTTPISAAVTTPVKFYFVTAFLGAVFGMVLIMVLTLWRIHISIDHFKTEVQNRKANVEQARSLSKRLGE